jgi:hypothetical protein
VALAACGSSSNSGPSYSVQGSAFGFYETSGCALGTNTIGTSAAIVEVTDYTSPTACDSMTANTVTAGDVAVELVIVRADFLTTGGPAPGLAAETYSFFDLSTLSGTHLPPFDGQGKAYFFMGRFLNCGAPGAGGGTIEGLVNGGSVTVTSVTPTQISGSVSASLAGGGTVTGSFTATVCAGAPAITPVQLCADMNALNLPLPAMTCI